MEKSNLVIVDANSFVHTSFHGYDDKIDYKGVDQKVLYGLVESLVGISYNIPKIDELIMVFDPKDSKLYRKSLYSKYKENRNEHDENLIAQKNSAEYIIKNKIGVPCINHVGYEADDSIGSLVHYFKKTKNIIVISPDKDLAQLICDNVIILKKNKKKNDKSYVNINKNNIVDYYGVMPNQIPDWLALVGDVSDNLPGIKGIGKKRAANLLKKYMTIEHMYAIIEEIEEKPLKEALIENKEQLLLVKKLTTTVNDLEIKSLWEKEMKRVEDIKTNVNYNDMLINLKNYFNWPNHFIEIFK